MCIEDIPVRLTNSPWEFGWDALVAISTFVLGGVALFVGMLPSIWDRKARKERAQYQSIMLAAELETALLPIMAVEKVAADRAPGAIPMRAFSRCQFELRKMELPLLERLLDRLDCFDAETREALAATYSGVKRVRIALPDPNRGEKMRTMDDADGVPTDVVRGLLVPVALLVRDAHSKLARYSRMSLDDNIKDAADILAEEIHASA